MVLIPRQTLRVPGSEFIAPPVTPGRDATGSQAQQLGRSMEIAGSRLARAGTEIEERLHIAAVKTAQARAEERIFAADDAYTGTLGEAATSKHRELAWADLQKGLTEIEGGLEHEVERRLYREVVRRRMLSVRSRWGKHENQQTLVYEIGAGKAALEGKKAAYRQQGSHGAAGAPDPSDPQQQGQQGIGPGDPAAGGQPTPQSSAEMLESIRAEARSVAGKMHLDPETTDLFVQEHVSEAHLGVIGDLVAVGKTAEAREYMANISAGDLHPDARQKIEGLLHRAGQQDEALRMSIDITEQVDALISSPPEPGVADTPTSPPTPELADTDPADIDVAQLLLGDRDSVLRRPKSTARESQQPEGMSISEFSPTPITDQMRADIEQSSRDLPEWERQTIVSSRGATRTAMVSAARLKMLAKAELNRRFMAGEISAELHGLTLNHIAHEAADRRQLAAEHENEIVDAIEAWASQNRGLGLADMPPQMYQALVEIGRLPEIISFLRSGRHINTSTAFADFMQRSREDLRNTPPSILRSQLRTQMDNQTLDWAMRVQTNMLKPGEDAEAGIEKRVIDEMLSQFGVETSSLEIGARQSGHQTDPDAVTFFRGLDGKADAVQAARFNRAWLHYIDLKTNLRATGQSIGREQVTDLWHQILVDERVGVSGSLLGYDFEGMPESALSGANLEQTFATVEGEEIMLQKIPGRMRATGRVENLFEGGDVYGLLIENAQAKNLSTAPRALLLEWLLLGKPRTRPEVHAAAEAVSELGGQVRRGSGSAGGREEAAIMARRAIERLRRNR